MPRLPIKIAIAAGLAIGLVFATGCCKSGSDSQSGAASAKDGKKKSIPTEKQAHPVPDEWTELVDDVKGFSFSVPKGTKDHQESKNGVNIYVAEVPKPHEVQVMAVSFKDAKKTKSDLIKDSLKIIESVGNKDIVAGEPQELNDDYSLTDVTCADSANGVKWRIRVLVAVDVTDNYLLLVGAPESEFKQSEETIDTIWGSFDMRSGGASGTSR